MIILVENIAVMFVNDSLTLHPIMFMKHNLDILVLLKLYPQLQQNCFLSLIEQTHKKICSIYNVLMECHFVGLFPQERLHYTRG